MAWLKLSLSTTSENIDSLMAQLWAVGSIGAEERGHGSEVQVAAFFSDYDQIPLQARTLGDPYWERFGATLESVEDFADRDWTTAHRMGTRPFSMGRGFVVDPREPETRVERPSGGRRLIRLPARRAFGIGSHESTRLVVEWLEDLDLESFRILDVGAGTGILSLVALARGAASVVAVELDLTAAFIASVNQELNGQRFPLIAGTVEALSLAAQFDLVLVNVLPENIKPYLERISALVRPGGRVLFSGILVQYSDRVSRRLERAGFAPCGRREIGEWEAIMVESLGT